MQFFNWVKSLFSSRGKALSLYRRGMARANKRDHVGALDDYTATIDMPNVPPDVKAMALYNRPLVYSAHHETAQAVDDLNRVLAMAETPHEIKTEARRRLERMKRQASKNTD